MALPRLNFQPVVDPYVSKPIEEFGSTIGVLRKDYDEALTEENRVRQAMASIQAAPFQEEYLQRANEELQQALGKVTEKGDYERQRSFIKQAANKYLSRALPIQQAGEQYRQFAEQATRLGVDPRVLEYIKRQETKNPSIKEVDGYTFNTFDTSKYQRFLRPEPNITEELTKIGSAVQAELRKRDQLGVLGARTKTNALPTDIPVKIGNETKWVDKSEVEALMRERSQDSDIRSYLENQKLLAQSEIEDNLFSDYMEMGFDPQEARLKAQQESEGIAAQQIQQDLQSTIDVAGDALSYKQIAQTFNPFNLPKSSSDGKDSSIGLSLKRKGTSVNVSDNIKNMSDLSDALSNIDKSIEQASTPQEQTALQMRKQRYQLAQDYINKQLPEIFKKENIEPEDQDLLAKYSGVSDTDIQREISSKASYSGTGTPTGYGVSKSLVDPELLKVQELRKRISNETKNKLSSILNINSLNPEVKQLPFTKNKDTNSTTREELKGFIQDDIESYDVILQDNRTLEEALLNLSEDEKERLKEISGDDPTVNNIFGELSIDGYTSVPVNGVPAITGKLSTKLNSIFGTDVYIVPKLGVNSGIYDYINQRGVSDNTISGLNKIGELGNYVEPTFQELILTNPEILPDGRNTLSFSEQLPIIDYSREKYKDSKGNDRYRINYRVIAPNGQSTSMQSADNFTEIRDNYYRIIDGIYE